MAGNGETSGVVFWQRQKQRKVHIKKKGVEWVVTHFIIRKY